MNSYTKTMWVNGQAPALSAANLNKIENGIEAVTNGVITLESDKIPKTRTVAGIDLQDDITSSELSAALSDDMFEDLELEDYAFLAGSEIETVEDLNGVKKGQYYYSITRGRIGVKISKPVPSGTPEYIETYTTGAVDTMIGNIRQDVPGRIPVSFGKHVGLVDCRDLSLYGNVSLGQYHASIPVTQGEKYRISCYSSNNVYPGAFYTLNGTKVSAIFEDASTTHLNAEITVPSGVDTLWLNNKSTKIALDDWAVYQILPSGEYCEENNSLIAQLEKERDDEERESMRRLKNLESLFTFRWKPFDKAYYCFVNDGSKKYLHIFYDVFHAHSTPFCAATIGGNIELANDTDTTPGGRTVKQTLDAIVADGGEVMVYLNAVADEVGTYDGWYQKAVKEGKRLIEAYGYTPRGLILSNNSPANSALGQKICERFFDYADHVGTLGSQYDIRRVQFADTSSVADVKAYIDSTVGTPGFYPIMMHGPYLEPWATYQGMDEILSYIENNYSSTAAISTYSHVFDTFKTNGFLTLSDLPVYSGGVQ